MDTPFRSGLQVVSIRYFNFCSTQSCFTQSCFVQTRYVKAVPWLVDVRAENQREIKTLRNVKKFVLAGIPTMDLPTTEPMRWPPDHSDSPTLFLIFLIIFQSSNETTLSEYFFEMTTTSFRIDTDGKLIVNQRNLDRDPPNENKLSFQVNRKIQNLKTLKKIKFLVYGIRRLVSRSPIHKAT